MCIRFISIIKIIIKNARKKIEYFLTQVLEVFQLIVVFVQVTFEQKLYHVHITKGERKSTFLLEKKTQGEEFLLDVIILDVHHELFERIYQILQNDMENDDQVQLIDVTKTMFYLSFFLHIR